MKDLSFLLLKNSVGSKMKKGFRNFCNGDGSTSTLNQKNSTANHNMSCTGTPSRDSFYFDEANLVGNAPTLEQMILQLEQEEAAATASKMKLDSEYHRRMSCVSNSDVLKSARNALNQYPRFSLDGRDAMYRSSFGNLAPVVGGRKSVCCSRGLEGRLCRGGFDFDMERNMSLPPTLAGESVVWCKPGVVAKLMGLEVMPVPITRKLGKARLGSIVRKQNGRRVERHEREKSRLSVGGNGCLGETDGSCSTTGYCVMKPINTDHHRALHAGKNWFADRPNYIDARHL